MRLGYARVSTSDQKLDLQRDALQAAGCVQVFTDTVSGATADRPGLSAALAACRRDDVLVVWKLDRLGRSLRHLVETVHVLDDRGVGFMSLQENIDTTTSGGRLIFHIFASLAEFERDLIRERTHAGLAAARARGRKGGRPKGVDQKKQKAALALKQNPQYSVREICEIVGISRNTYYKYTRGEDTSRAQPAPSPIPPVSAPPSPRVMKVTMRLRVETNSKFVRGKGKARVEIEQLVLRRYGLETAGQDRGAYLLTIPYTTDEDLDRRLDELWHEAAHLADLRNCFIEGDIVALEEPGRHWPG